MKKEKFLDLFRYNLEKQPMSLEDKKDSLEKGIESLAGYFDEYENSWNQNLLTEVSLKGIELSVDKETKIQLTGKLDKIEILQGRKVAVIDYKTSKPKSKNEIEGLTKGSDGNYKRQLVFYKLLLDDIKKYDMEYGVIDFVEPNSRGIYKKEQFMIASGEVEELRSVIEIAVRGILSLSFIDLKCEEKDCEYCRLGAVLRGKTS